MTPRYFASMSWIAALDSGGFPRNGNEVVGDECSPCTELVSLGGMSR